MNQYITGTTIKKLREKQSITQSELAAKLSVSDKTISKWETGKGYPDITILEPLAKIFNVSITELFSGNTIINENVHANMLKTKIYVCPVCGNIICSTGEMVVSCHGIDLMPLEAEVSDIKHNFNISKVEDEYFVENINHEMTKNHYISFIISKTNDKVNIVKLYPEGKCEARFKIGEAKEIYCYCNKDGLYKIK